MTNTKLACIWRDGCNQFDVCQAAECCQAIRSNREKAELPPSNERFSKVDKILNNMLAIRNVHGDQFVSIHTFGGYLDVENGRLLRDWLNMALPASAHEPRADQCEVCTKPLPPVGVWSMPSCPDCQELLEGLGQIMADFADREQTIKADWIGRAINLICARPSQPPRVICGPELAHAMDKLGAIVNGQTERITPIEANALLTNWRQLQSDARTAQPPCELPEGFPAISDTSLRDLRDTTKSVLLQSALIELQMRRAAQPPAPEQWQPLPAGPTPTKGANDAS